MQENTRRAVQNKQQLEKKHDYRVVDMYRFRDIKGRGLHR